MNDYYTLKTGTPVEDGDSVLKLLRGISRPEIQLGVGINSELDRLETVFQMISKLHIFSLRMELASSVILNFLECNFGISRS